MVSINDPFIHSVDMLVAALKREIEACSVDDELSALLCQHFLGERANQLGLTKFSTIDLEKWVDTNRSSLHEAPFLSVLGSLAFVEIRKGGSPSDKAGIAFRDGLTGLSARQKVFSVPNSWMLHPANVIGVGLGASVTDYIDPEQGRWWQEILQEGLRHDEIPLFSRFVYVYCLYLLNPSLVHELPAGLLPTNFENPTLAELAVSIWMVKRGILQTNIQGTADWLDQAQSHWLLRCLTEGTEPLSNFKAAIALDALTGYVFTRSQYPRLELVISLLSNFSAAMERWSSRWPVSDEYDVQSLLWFILRSAFDDAGYEDNLPKFGRSAHRFDIGLPQLGLLVEAKYVRDPRKDFQSIVEAIGKDSAQITTQSTYKEILVFIYDASRAAEQHDWAKKTIEKIARVRGCIIHSAPSSLKGPILPQRKLRRRSGKSSR